MYKSEFSNFGMRRCYFLFVLHLIITNSMRLWCTIQKRSRVNTVRADAITEVYRLIYNFSIDRRVYASHHFISHLRIARMKYPIIDTNVNQHQMYRLRFYATKARCDHAHGEILSWIEYENSVAQKIRLNKYINAHTTT